MLDVNPQTIPRLLEAIKFATEHGLLEQLLDKLDYLRHYANGNGCAYDKARGRDTRCSLYEDFAPLSFAIHMEFRTAPAATWEHLFNGGLIYQGPGQPADGSMPSLTVSLTEGIGWFIHT